VDPDAGVEREAVEEGAVPAVPKLVGEPLPPVHLGGMEGGQGVGFGLEVLVADESPRRAPYHPLQDGRQILVRWRR
jgi:hypothetical protein